VHCSAAAKHNAATERPEPGGPVISQACVIVPWSEAL
jgi:adenylate cyclase